jgi:CRP-like cAMP-binding protein
MARDVGHRAAPSGDRTLDMVGLFAPLSAEERSRLASACAWRTFRHNEQIFDRLDTGRDVFFIARGKARIVNFSFSGREVSLVDLGPGDFFGELAAIDGQPRSASVMAIGETLVAAMPATAFLRIVSEHPDIAMAMIQYLARMVRRATERIMELSTLGANNRVHAELLRLAATAGEDRNAAVISPIPTHSDIAARVSTTRETVARVLSELNRAGLVKRQGDRLVITDLGRLEDMVEEVRGLA